MRFLFSTYEQNKNPQGEDRTQYKRFMQKVQRHCERPEYVSITYFYFDTCIHQFCLPIQTSLRGTGALLDWRQNISLWQLLYSTLSQSHAKQIKSIHYLTVHALLRRKQIFQQKGKQSDKNGATTANSKIDGHSKSKMENFIALNHRIDLRVVCVTKFMIILLPEKDAN